MKKESDIMPYGEAKVYTDGAHYIAIPHTTNPKRRRKQPKEEMISVLFKSDGTLADNVAAGGFAVEKEDNDASECEKRQGKEQKEEKDDKSYGIRMTRKDLFDRLYKETADVRRKAERKNIILKAMTPYFRDEEKAETYVERNIERKLRNEICRRVRLHRKANLQDFNYFVTFTYNSELHTEETFRKKLRTCLRHLVERKGWKYIAVWERSPEKKRLHFHGMFYIPEGSMPGLLFEKKDYSTKNHRMQTSVQNTYFNENFGRSDFEEITSSYVYDDAINYMAKYIEKSGERIIYSKGLPQYFISDIMDEDVLSPYGVDDRKLLLFDNFRCWDEGCYMGRVSKEVIAQMRKCN